MIIEALFAVLIAICILHAWVTWRVVHDDLSSPTQRVAQIVLVLMLPAVGALMVLNLQRRKGEKGLGRYHEIPDPGDDFGQVAGSNPAPATKQKKGFRTEALFFVFVR